MTSSIRALATILAAWDDDALAVLIEHRSATGAEQWRDVFDLAEALLDPASIRLALAELPRDVLAAMDARTPVPEAAVAGSATLASLVDENRLPYPEVAHELTGVDIGAHLDAHINAADVPRSTPEQTEACAERAAQTVTAIAELLWLGDTAPVTLIADGRPNATERRRLVGEGIATTTDEAVALVQLATTAGLTSRNGRLLTATLSADVWLELPLAARWTRLVTAVVAAAPDALRNGDVFRPAPESWPELYPLDPTWPDRAVTWRETAVLLGLFAEDGTEPHWTGASRAHGSLTGDALTESLPDEVDRMFVQNDLSVVAPGPPRGDVDVRIRAVADRDRAAGARAYRITPSSIERALAAGHGPDEIFATLNEISLTPIPQAAIYLIRERADRYGTVRVTALAHGRGTRVTSTDATMLAAIERDRAVTAFDFRRDGDDLVSPASAYAVHAGLSDARYPARLIETAAVDTSRSDGPDGGGAHARAAKVVARLREGTTDASDATWRARELERAVRERSTIVVTVAMPDGAEREFTLEVSGCSGGRLRGREPGSEIERTLPLSHIRAVHEAG